MIKARIEVKGELAFITTEYGQKATIPLDSLCEFIKRANLVIENNEEINKKCN